MKQTLTNDWLRRHHTTESPGTIFIRLVIEWWIMIAVLSPACLGMVFGIDDSPTLPRQRCTAPASGRPHKFSKILSVLPQHACIFRSPHRPPA